MLGGDLDGLGGDFDHLLGAADAKGDGKIDAAADFDLNLISLGPGKTLRRNFYDVAARGKEHEAIETLFVAGCRSLDADRFVGNRNCGSGNRCTSAVCNSTQNLACAGLYLRHKTGRHDQQCYDRDDRYADEPVEIAPHCHLLSNLVTPHLTQIRVVSWVLALEKFLHFFACARQGTGRE